jgi:hypothetical protein
MRLHTATPVLLVADIAATVAWYSRTLRFETRVVPEAPPHAFGIMRRGGVEIFLQQLAGYATPDLYRQRDGGVWHVYVHMEGVRDLYQHVSTQDNVSIVKRLTRQPYGQIEFELKDPNGYVIVFAESFGEEPR